jgi:hypothetical protein
LLTKLRVKVAALIVSAKGVNSCTRGGKVLQGLNADT